jgi:probable rRNA maturation factor
LGWSEAELSLTLVNDRAMAKLNRETFGRRGPTNVIAFPIDIETPGQVAPPPAPPESPPPNPQTFGSTGSQPMFSGEGRFSAAPPPILGEVVISLETTRRQARESGWPFEELMDFYLIHGILHLLGYDHQTPEDEAAMDAKMRELMEVVASDQ